ncbi:hypothetical protein OQA88_10894 [Cercophora sp. LCS_1]
MSTPTSDSESMRRPDSRNGWKYGDKHQQELYNELRQLVKKTEQGFQGSYSLEMIIAKLAETYPKGRRRLKKKLDVKDKKLESIQKQLDEANNREATLQAEKEAMEQGMAALGREHVEQAERAKRLDTERQTLSEDVQRREEQGRELQERLESTQKEVRNLADALEKERESSKQAKQARDELKESIGALERDRRQELEIREKVEQGLHENIVKLGKEITVSDGDAAKARKELEERSEKFKRDEQALREELVQEKREKQKIHGELSTARSETAIILKEQKREGENFRRGEQALRQEKQDLHDALDLARKEAAEAQQKLAISVGLLKNMEMEPALPPPINHKEVLAAAVDEFFNDEANWEQLKEKYPVLWRRHTFATWEEAKASLPPKLVEELTDTMYFRWQQSNGKPVKTSVFFDSGNHVGPLLSDSKLEELGCTIDDIDTEDRLMFRGATGELGYTLGSINMERTQEDDSTSGTTDSPRTFLKFHVWKDHIGLGEVIFGRDQASEFRPGKDGIPPLLLTTRVRPPTAEEKEEMALNMINRDRERVGVPPLDSLTRATPSELKRLKEAEEESSVCPSCEIMKGRAEPMVPMSPVVSHLRMMTQEDAERLDQQLFIVVACRAPCAKAGLQRSQWVETKALETRRAGTESVLHPSCGGIGGRNAPISGAVQQNYERERE